MILLNVRDYLDCGFATGHLTQNLREVVTDTLVTQAILHHLPKVRQRVSGNELAIFYIRKPASTLFGAVKSQHSAIDLCTNLHYPQWVISINLIIAILDLFIPDPLLAHSLTVYNLTKKSLMLLAEV